MKKQTGFVLVSVLIITTITTMLAFSQINENRLQERIGGNQQKELNARLAAERGVFDAYAYIKSENAAGTSNADIETVLNEDSFPKSDDYSFPEITFDYSSSNFILLSMGEVNGAIAYLKTQIEAVEERGVYNDAVIGCDSVTVGGNAKVDSFKGKAYVETKAPDKTNSNGNVTVIKGNATTSSTSAEGKGVWGDVTVSGTITGDDITGNIISGYKGSLGECDPLDIANNMPTISAEATLITNTINAKTDGDTVIFGKEAGAIYEKDKKTTELTSLANMSTTDYVLFDDEATATTPVYVFSDLNLTGKSVEISGDVTFYIKGDMITSSTIFTLANSSSSLTIFIEGNMDIDTGSDTFSSEFVGDSGNVPLTVYSSNTGSYMGNNGDTAVNLGGNADIYMNVYAPLGAIYYNGGGDILGALRGKEVEISGTGGIHYDEGLNDIGDPEVPASSSYSSVYYYYPENE